MSIKEIAEYGYRSRIFALLVITSVLAMLGSIIEAESSWHIACMSVAFVATGTAAYYLHGRRTRARYYQTPARTEYLTIPLFVGKDLYATDSRSPLKGWVLHDTYQKHSDIALIGDTLRFVTPARTADEWNYLFLDPQIYCWTNFSWAINFRRETTFREYAFNFRYQDFDNRYRYRFEDDKLFFDKKVAGQWVNNIASVPFIMVLGQWYSLRIDAIGTLYRCYVDGKLLLENCDTDLAHGSVSLILWEDDGVTDIVAEVGPSRINELIADRGSGI